MTISAFPFLLLRAPLQSLSCVSFPDHTPAAIFDEGLYLASGDFWKEYQKMKASGNDDKKLLRTYLKYWIRSCMRCTPYGTFAGSKLIAIENEETRMIVADSSRHIRRIRVDTNCVAEVIAEIGAVDHIREQVTFFPNNSIYEMPDGFRYAEYTVENNRRDYRLTSIRAAPYIKEVLRRAAGGATLAELSRLLTDQAFAGPEEALTFLQEMIQAQLLIPDLEASVTGGEPLDVLIEQLEHLSGTENFLPRLKDIRQMIRDPRPGTGQYAAIEAGIRGTGFLAEMPKHTLQTDLFLSTHEHTINRELVDEIVRQTADLGLLARAYKNGDLEDFKRRFSARYEEAEVGLAIALDADLGIGYAGVRDESAGGGKLIDDLAAAGHSPGSELAAYSYIRQFTLSKYNDYLENGGAGIVVTDEELAGFKGEVDGLKFPNSQYLMGSILKKDGLLDKDHFVFGVSSLGGPSAANLLGRFTHGDEELCRLTKEILRSEEMEHPDAIYAEIAHLPQARIGNILLRPVLRAYEIPYVGKSGAPPGAQIPVDDLLVSVRNDEVFLRSRRHNRRVIPRLTTAHNYSHSSLPVYKFLCDLQSQGTASPNVWDWGPLASSKHLPRVSYRNLILQKEKWRVTEKDIAGLPQEEEQHLSWARGFCEKQRLPQRVVYSSGDNDLLIDFGDGAGVDLFLHYLKRYKAIQLEEFLFTEANCIVRDEQNRPYTNEVIIPLFSKVPDREAAVDVACNRESAAKRKFLPNSEWQYFKIYCGSKTAEKILCETVLPFIEAGRTAKLFERFFFVRYRDEFGHLRIRFYNSDKTKQAALQSAFLEVLQPLVEAGTIDKVILDTYIREIERYGADCMDDSESLFCNDSLAVLRFLDMLDEDTGEKYRLLFALRGIDMLLDDFGCSSAVKNDLLKSLQASFFREFGGSPRLQKQLNDKYRQHRQDIFSHMNPALDSSNEIEEAIGVFSARSKMNVPVIQSIKTIMDENPGPARNRLLGSYIHMFMNRLFIAQQRKYELIVYHFLEKYYSSQSAISKKNEVPSNPVEVHPA